MTCLLIPFDLLCYTFSLTTYCDVPGIGLLYIVTLLGYYIITTATFQEYGTASQRDCFTIRESSRVQAVLSLFQHQQVYGIKGLSLRNIFRWFLMASSVLYIEPVFVVLKDTRMKWMLEEINSSQYAYCCRNVTSL